MSMYKKYIKGFKESVDVGIEEYIIEETKGLLANYIDEFDAGVAAKSYIVDNEHNYSIYISTLDFIKWEDCKDDIIPYIQYMNNKYKILILPYFNNKLNCEIRLYSISDNQDITIYKKLSELENIDDDIYFYEIHIMIS